MPIPKSTWRQLYRSIYNQTCILILGPKMATFRVNDNEEMLLEGFSKQLAEELDTKGISYEKTQRNDLAYTALRWQKGARLSSSMLREEYCSFFQANAMFSPEAYKELAKLPFFLVVNTNAEEYMLQAFQRTGKEANQLHYNYQRNQTPLIPKMSTEQPLIYNLFGDIKDPESLVITKEDEVEFINNLLKNQSTLPTEVLQHFNKKKTYLFLGFDANTWHLPLLFRSLRLQTEKEISFYLHQQQLNTSTKDFYTDSFDFQFISEKLKDFSINLNKGYQTWLQTQTPAVVQQKKLVPIDKPQTGIGGKVNILMLTANPKGTTALELNEEINAVEEAHQKGTQRSKFFFKPILNTKKEQLLDVLLTQSPQIVHFSGHGTGRAGLIFYGENGEADMVQGQKLARLFSRFSNQISCIVLNACYSEVQAQTIAQHIPNVIGADNAIGDPLAIRFTEGFYAALFAGRSYLDAYNMAIDNIGLSNFPAGGRPVFYQNGQKH